MDVNALYVQTQGSYGKEPLIFLHAFPLASDMWKEQMQFFSRTHYTLAPDLPGFGKGTLPGHAITFEHYVESVQNFLKETGIKQSVWCGLSMGGYLALRLYQKAPELCSGLILADTKSTPDDNLGKEKRWSSIKKLHSHREEFMEKQWLSMVGKSSRDNLKLKKIFYEITERNTEEGISSGLVSLTTRMDCSDMLKDIHVPTLILVGEEDKVTPFSDAQHLHKNIANSRLEMIPKAGHLSNMENPQAFNKAVSEFLVSLHTHQYQSLVN
ncbi:alpha/beta hydrolase [Bacteriovorax stolpii]|uniref:Uncharacterized protein n=1 Tax=Bacteriovorax stolpii TaxID=960 RepID=A0A2K9NR04_BACTC|nr:alpha/beta hydrolase [Bacteriovorax stolpii]AUN97505.1 hypothetical protein C0V70_05140 [Bacteriovorax stolpii]QDK42523.1 alpha/beta hydrolase [Bacteriovorax stolpii]TDP52684.1 pimeloyl-ACP methyl ester carboxylesterase [Bacteriovorax stolpii]